MKNSDLRWVQPSYSFNADEAEPAPRRKKRQKSAKTDPPADKKQENFTVAEVAEMLSLSVETIRRLFKDEPGVLKMKNASGPTGRRRYMTLRIPAAVVERVRRKNSA